MPDTIGANAKDQGWQAPPALKVCMTTALSKKEVEKAGIIIRHSITKIMKKS
jgi:hypothetical protein